MGRGKRKPHAHQQQPPLPQQQQPQHLPPPPPPQQQQQQQQHFLLLPPPQQQQHLQQQLQFPPQQHSQFPPQQHLNFPQQQPQLLLLPSHLGQHHARPPIVAVPELGAGPRPAAVPQPRAPAVLNTQLQPLQSPRRAAQPRPPPPAAPPPPPPPLALAALKEDPSALLAALAPRSELSDDDARGVLLALVEGIAARRKRLGNSVADRMQAALAEHPGLKRLLSGITTLAAQWGVEAALEVLDLMAALQKGVPQVRTAGKKACDAVCQALARGAARLGPAGLVRVTAVFAEMKHFPTALLAEAPLRAVMRGEATNEGASALLELLLTLGGMPGDGDAGAPASLLPTPQSEGVVRALLDALPRLSPPTLAAVLASFPRLGLGSPGCRLLVRLSAEYARRPVQSPPIALLLAVLRGVAETAAAEEAAGSNTSKSSYNTLLSCLWDDLHMQLVQLNATDLAAATGLLARLGCLAPTTPWKAQARAAIAAELGRRLGPDALQGALLAQLPGLLGSLQTVDPSQLGELAGEIKAALQRGLEAAPAGTVWQCVMEAAPLGLFRSTGAGSDIGQTLLEAAAPKLGILVSEATAAAAQSSSNGGGGSNGGGVGEGAVVVSPFVDAGSPDLAALAAIVSAWNAAGAPVRCHSAALLAWLDLPCVTAVFDRQQQPQENIPATLPGAAENPPAQPQQPVVALDTNSWQLLARLAQGIVDALSYAAEAAEVGTEPAEPPSMFVAAFVHTVEAQGPKAAGGTGGAQACTPPDAVTLLWTLSVLGGLGLATWDVLAAAMDAPAATYNIHQRSRVFEAHALILLRLHGTTQLATPAGELLRCREAYWESTLLPSTAKRAALAGGLLHCGLLPPNSGVTVPAQGHWLLVDCVDPGSQIAWTFAPLRPVAVRLATRAALLMHSWEQVEVAASDLTDPGEQLTAQLRSHADAAHSARNMRLSAILSPLRGLIEVQRAAGAGASVAQLATLVNSIDAARTAGLVPTVTAQQLAIMRQIAGIAGTMPVQDLGQQAAASAAWEVPDSPVPEVPTAPGRWDAVDVFLAAHASTNTWLASVERLLVPPLGQTPPPPAHPELIGMDILSLAEAAAAAARHSWQPEEEKPVAEPVVDQGGSESAPARGGQRRQLGRGTGSSSSGDSSSDDEDQPAHKRPRRDVRTWRQSRSRSRSRSCDSGVTTDGAASGGEEEGEVAAASRQPVQPSPQLQGVSGDTMVPASFTGRVAPLKSPQQRRQVRDSAPRPRHSRSRSRSQERGAPYRSPTPGTVGVQVTAAASAWAFGGSPPEGGSVDQRKARRAAAAVAVARASLADSRGHHQQPVSSSYCQQLLSMLDSGLEEGGSQH